MQEAASYGRALGRSLAMEVAQREQLPSHYWLAATTLAAAALAANSGQRSHYQQNYEDEEGYSYVYAPAAFLGFLRGRIMILPLQLISNYL